MRDDFDPHLRELCPDGTCIGLIGPDGRCKECGLPGPNVNRDPRLRDLILNADAEGDARQEPSSPEPFESAQTDLGASAADEEDEDIDSRELCPDGACIGVLGEDGRCKECGARA